MSPYRTVCFCEWQNDDSTQIALGQPNTLAFGAFGAPSLMVGAIIGGLMGTRAVVNHIAVRTEVRGQGIGDKLFALFKQEAARMKIYRIFLFVDKENVRGRRFWESRDFREVLTELTLETDI